MKSDSRPHAEEDIKPDVAVLTFGESHRGINPDMQDDSKPDLSGETDVKPVLDDDEEEEEEGDYDATDDYIILPDGPPLDFAVEADDKEEEDYYSDDQLFAQGTSAGT